VGTWYGWCWKHLSVSSGGLFVVQSDNPWEHSSCVLWTLILESLPRLFACLCQRVVVFLRYHRSYLDRWFELYCIYSWKHLNGRVSRWKLARSWFLWFLGGYVRDWAYQGDEEGPALASCEVDDASLMLLHFIVPCFLKSSIPPFLARERTPSPSISSKQVVRWFSSSNA
jgi:hypothetical protein